VYEYGGLPYAVIPGEKRRILFSDSKNKTIGLLNIDHQTVDTVFESKALRYAEFDAHPHIADGSEENAWVVAVEEDHEGDPRPEDVCNYIVVINLVTKVIKRVVEGADFYTYPRFSPDGDKVAWIEWNHPGLPFLSTKLKLGDFDKETGAVSNVQLIAGDEKESVAEPRWSPDGKLFFGSDKNGFRQLRAWSSAGEVTTFDIPGLEDSEIGDASWHLGW